MWVGPVHRITNVRPRDDEDVMVRKYNDVQADRDIRRAEHIVQETHSMSTPDGIRVLRECASELGVSVHAIALAVLSGERPAIVSDRAPAPEQGAARDRLRQALDDPATTRAPPRPWSPG
jgi:hypothetical protein